MSVTRATRPGDPNPTDRRYRVAEIQCDGHGREIECRERVGDASERIWYAVVTAVAELPVGPGQSVPLVIRQWVEIPGADTATEAWDGADAALQRAAREAQRPPIWRPGQS